MSTPSDADNIIVAQFNRITSVAQRSLDIFDFGCTE